MRKMLLFDGTPSVAQMDAIIALYDQGRAVRAVAADLGFTFEAVHRSLRRSDLLREEDQKQPPHRRTG